MDDLKARLLQAQPSNPFAVMYLQLCQISYADDFSMYPTYLQQVDTFDSDSSWKLVWGPAYDSDNATLVYVAAYYSGSQPVFAAVVTRGTDLAVDDIWGELTQVFWDLYVPLQSTPTWISDASILVADGTLDALTAVQGLTSDNTTLIDFITNFVSAPENLNPLVIATGHSLGGCVTTVLAPWLKYKFQENNITTPIVTATFAAPTAGNAAFGQYLADTITYCPRYFNSMDIVPNAWWNLAGIETIYDPCGLPLPDLVYAGIVSFEGAMDLTGATYAQPPTCNAELKNGCPALLPPLDWYGEAAYQHSEYTYMGLLGGNSINIIGRTAPAQPASRPSAMLRSGIAQSRPPRGRAEGVPAGQ